MIFLGADHRGYKLKEDIKKYLDEKGVQYKDCGTYSEERTDYPLIAKAVCSTMDTKKDKAVLICGSGIAMAMTANKFKGVRAGVCFNEGAVRDGKEHGDLNVLVLPADFMKIDEAVKIVDLWQELKFLEGRYLERQKMLEEIENENMK